MLVSLYALPDRLVALSFIVFALDSPSNGATRLDSRPFRHVPEAIRPGSPTAADV